MSVCQGLCGYGSSVFAAWKGEVGDDRLFFGAFNGTTWDNQGNTIPGNSSVGPALAATANGLIYAAWKGEDDNDQRLFYAPYNVSKQTWSSQTQIPNVASSIGPALAAIGNTLYAAWVGTNNDLSMHFASFDPSNQNPTWSSLPGIPATDVPAVTSSSIGPALAAIGPTLYAAWADLNGILHFAALDTSAPTPTWSIPTKILGVLSSIGPALAALGGTLYAAWKGSGNDQSLYYASFDPSNKNPTWSGQAQIPNVGSSIGPALAALGNTLYAAWKGEGTDQSLYYASFVPSNKNPTWSGQAPLGGNTGQDMVPPPIGGLGSNSNYLLYGGSCNPATQLSELSVTIEITEDIVCDDLGFHVQWNAGSPTGQSTTGQQYIMGFNPKYQGNSETPAGPIIGSGLEYFPGSDFPNINPLDKYVMPPSPNPQTLPAGYVFTISLTTTAGNITNASYSVVGNDPSSPKNSKSWSIALPPSGVSQSVLTPIAAFQLNIVGKGGGDSAHMTSGAGKITYTSSTDLTVVNVWPPCAQSITTAETANSFYSTLPPTPSRSIVQTFGVNPST